MIFVIMSFNLQAFEALSVNHVISKSQMVSIQMTITAVVRISLLREALDNFHQLTPSGAGSLPMIVMEARLSALFMVLTWF